MKIPFKTKSVFNKVAKGAVLGASLTTIGYSFNILAHEPRNVGELALVLSDLIVKEDETMLGDKKYKIAEFLEDFLETTDSVKCSKVLIFNKCTLKADRRDAIFTLLKLIGPSLKQDDEPTVSPPLRYDNI